VPYSRKTVIKNKKTEINFETDWLESISKALIPLAGIVVYRLKIYITDGGSNSLYEKRFSDTYKVAVDQLVGKPGAYGDAGGRVYEKMYKYKNECIEIHEMSEVQSYPG